MREVANFMRMYPAYNLRAVLEEYAVTFYALLNEGYRLQNHNYFMLAHIARATNADNTDFSQFIKQLEWASMHPSDILKSSGEGSSPTDIKKILGG